MKLSIVLIAVLLPFITLLNAEDSQDSQDFLDFLTQTVNTFKLNFHKSFEQSRVRRKQDYTLPSKGALTEQDLKVVNTSTAIPSHVLSGNRQNGPIRVWAVIEDSVHYTYLFSGHANGLLVLANLKMVPSGAKAQDQIAEVTPLAYYFEKGNGVPFKTQYFLYESYIWLVVAFKSRGEREYLAVYQYNPNARTFHRRQTIEMDIQSDFDVIQRGDSPYMAVSSYMKRTSVGTTLQTSATLYEWRHTQFDEIATARTDSATSVKLFQMSGALYMAVAQYNRSLTMGNEYNRHFPVGGSAVFSYNSREDEKLTAVQVIHHFATRVDHFRVDGNDYLIFVNPNERSRIYWWAGDQFLIYQDLVETEHAMAVAVTRLPNAEILLAFLFKDRVVFFTESPNAKYEPDGQLVIPEPAFVDIKLFAYLKRAYFAVFTFEDMMKAPLSAVWRLHLMGKPPPEHHHETDPLRICLKKLEQSLSNREEGLVQLTKQADRVWLKDQLQEVKSPVVVTGKLIVNSLNAKTLLLTNGNKPVPQITNTDVNSRVNRLTNKVDTIANDMNNLVYKTGDQIIEGRTVFTEPISAGHSSVKSVANNDMLLNGIKVNTLAEESLKINGNQVINAHLSLNNGLTVDNLVVRQAINNVNVSDVLLSNWPQTQEVTGNHVYRDVSLHSHLNLHRQFGSINGIRPAHIVTKTGPKQEIVGNKVFNSLDATSIAMSGTINGHKIGDIARRAVRLNGPTQHITGQLIMDSPITVSQMTIKGAINKVVNVTELALNAVTINGEQAIAGRKQFEGPVWVRGDVALNGRVNGLKLKTDVITTNTNQNLTGNLVFKSDAHFANNIETNSVNGMNLRADSVLKNTPHNQLVGRKIFNKTITVLSDITMDSGSTLDGTDPSELLKLAINKTNTVFEAPVTVGKLIVNGNIIAKHINQYPVKDLPHILWLKSANQTIPVPVVIEGPLNIRQLSSPNVNGFRVPEDFVHKRLNPHEVIAGEKWFNNPVIVKGNVALRDGKRVNGLDLKSFERRVVKKDGINNAIDIIGGEIHMKSVKVLGNVITANVNGFATSDVMLTYGKQIINGNLILMSPTTHISGQLEVMSDINVKTTVNNEKLSHFAQDLVLSDHWPATHQRPIINKHFAAGIGAKHMVVEGTVGGVDINYMKSNVVTLDTQQEVSSHKNFTQNTAFISDLISDLLNGIKIREFGPNVILKNEKGIIIVRGFKTFTGDVILRSDLNLSGTVNGINVVDLARRVVSRTRNNVILAPMTFVNDLHLRHLTLRSPATIDGLSPNELAFVGNNLLLSGNNRFNQTVSALTDIFVGKTINGCNLRDLERNAVLRDSISHFQSLRGAKEFNSLNVLGNVIIEGPINGVDFNRLVSQIVSRTDAQVIRAPVTFENDVMVEHLILRNVINGRNLTFILNDAVLKSKPQTIVSKKHFSGPSLVANGSRTQVDGAVNVKGLVNGVNIETLDQTTVKLGSTGPSATQRPITGVKTLAGRVTFKRDAFIGGTLSGISFPNDVILVNTNESIAGVTRFQRWISGLRGLFVNGLIDGMNLTHFVANRLTLDGDRELIQSALHFTNRVTVDNLVVRKTINNIPVDAFVTTKGRYLITGSKTFASDLFVRGNIQSPGVYNGINIHNLVNRAVSLTKPEFITGNTEFIQPVSMSQMHINGRLNGYDISDMANFFGKLTTEVDKHLDAIGLQLRRQGKTLEAQFAALNKDRSSGIDHFFLTQEIYESDPRLLNKSPPRLNSRLSSQPSANITVSTANNELFVVSANDWSPNDGNNCNEDNKPYTQHLYILRFNGIDYELFQILDINGVISLDTFQVSQQTYIAAASHRLGATYVLQYRGYNKFEVIETIPTPGVVNVKSFWSSDGNLHLSIASSKLGHSMILTAFLNGSTDTKKYSTIDELLYDHNKL